MAPRNKPAWKAKGKGGDSSPKELEWQDRQQRSNLEANAAARQVGRPQHCRAAPTAIELMILRPQKRVEARRVQGSLEVPLEVVEWFDRSRVALMALAEVDPGVWRRLGLTLRLTPSHRQEHPHATCTPDSQ